MYTGFRIVFCTWVKITQPTVSVNNLCYLIKLVSLFPAWVIYSLVVVLSTVVILSSFCHLLTLSNVAYVPYKCIACSQHTYNSLSCLIGRRSSVPIDLSNSTGIFDHRAILIWRDRVMAGGFSPRTK